jgi:hypothetical protein
MGSLDFSIELRRSRFYIDMPHTLIFDMIFDMPVKLGLKLMAPV